MAYTDRRRETFAALAGRLETLRRQASFERRYARPIIVWLHSDPQTGTPEVTQRVTGLRPYRLIRCRNGETYRAAERRVGLKIWTVEDVETHERHDLDEMGNGTTVWIVDPRAAS